MVWFMVFNWWRKPEYRRKSLTCHKSLTNFIMLYYLYLTMLYTSQWTGFELTTIVVIGTDCTGSCKSNYLTIMTTTGPRSSSNINLIINHMYNMLRSMSIWPFVLKHYINQWKRCMPVSSNKGINGKPQEN